MATNRKYKIGEVHAELRQEFPDLELSKIRYYEEQGLVFPSRSKSKYRLFSEDDVTTLREALRLTAKGVSIAEVRDRLVALSYLPAPTATAAPRQTAARDASTARITMSYVAVEDKTPVRSEPAPPLRVVENEEQLTLAPASFEFISAGELLDYAGLTPQQLNDLQAQGFITPTEHRGQLSFTARDAQVAVAIAPLLRRGVELRRLAALRRTVQRQMDVLDEITQPLRLARGDQHRDVVEVTNEISRVHDALYRAAVEEFLQ